MKNSLLVLFVLLFVACEGQQPRPSQQPSAQVAEEAGPSAAPAIPAYASKLYKQHAQYLETAITHRRFKHQDIEPLLQQLQPPFSVEMSGRSIEGRSIYHCQWGEGPVKVLLWSQMHGDEPTATMALMDIFNFLSASDEFDALRQRLRSSLSLHFLPMLNPDGAEAFVRRNALGVDLNRDALRLQCPESVILKELRDEVKADWGFNLHDQNRYYAAGRSGGSASISFLAPAYNYEKGVDEKRADAMQMIGFLDQLLQPYLPQKIARYDDEFEPRAFGDNMQKWGTRTILVESGGLEGDPEKQELRRIHFVLLLTALDMIATRQYESVPVAKYNQIPMNNSQAYFDLLVREVEIEREGQWYTVDLGFRRPEVEYGRDELGYYATGQLFDLGDLSTFWAYEELSGQGYRAVTGRLYPNAFESLEALKQADVISLVKDGYTAFHVTTFPPVNVRKLQPVEIITDPKRYYNDISMYGNPSLLLQKGGQTHYLIVNGRLIDLQDEKGFWDTNRNGR
jgi:hypothetical protein